tara:strand:+ start:5767 stop:6036 length:270 start_codon:yes stop_codon:yes gene_type:complete
MVKVRYITGAKIGWITQYHRSIAVEYVRRGLIEIMDEPVASDNDISADMSITTEMTKATLEKIASLRGVELPSKVTKKQIIEILIQREK